MATGGCPDDDALARVAAGTAGEAERDRVIDHLDGCATCRRGVAALAAASIPATPVDSFVGGDATPTQPEPPDEALTARVAGRPRPPGVSPGIPVLGDRIGRYVALRIVGRGGMGIVIAAHDPELDRQVAIKLVHPRVWRAASAESRELLRQEARAMARLIHPNVVAVHDLGTVDDQLFVAMELVTGSSLDRWLADTTRPWHQVLAMCREAGKGIAAAHHAGLVHRDIKPHNVLIDDLGRPRIADFGLAVLGQTETRDDATPAGTPAYMSPEQHHTTTVTAASDQFSFCVMVYEALYRERPFAGDTVGAIAAEIDRGRLRPPPPRSPVPSAIRRALVRGLATDPAARFPSMEALLAALEPRQRGRWVLAGAAVALAAVAGAGAIFLTRDADPVAATRAAAERRVAAIWSPGARRTLGSALATGGPTHAAATSQRVVGAIDRYVASWIATRIEVARAARAGEQAPAAAERRLACLDRRLDEVRALVAALSAGGAGAAAAAIDGVNELTPAAVCIERDVMAVRPPPEEPSRRARYDELVRAVADVAALQRVGRQKDAATAAEALVADARAFDHPPLLAEVLILHARALIYLGETDRAIAIYRETVPAAAAAGDAELEAAAWLELISAITNGGRGKPPDEIMVAAAAAVARAGTNPLVRASYHRALALAAITAGRYAVAEAEQRKAYDATPADHPKRPHVMLGIATAMGEQGRFADAMPLLEEARTAAEQVYGADHPSMAIYWANLQVALEGLGRLEEALAAARKVRAVAEPGTLYAGLGVMYEAGSLAAMGRDGEAIPMFETAVEIFRRAGNRRQEFQAWMHIAVASFNIDDQARAARSLEQALVLGRPMFADQPGALTFATMMLGRIALSDGDLAAASARCAEAVTMAGTPDNPARAMPLICVAEAQRRLGNPAAALATAEAALVSAGLGPAPEPQINARLEVVRALTGLGRDRPRRRALLRAALALIEVEEWRSEITQEFRADL